MFCPYCGEIAQEEDKFCHNCGTEISKHIEIMRAKILQPTSEVVETPPSPVPPIEEGWAVKLAGFKKIPNLLRLVGGLIILAAIFLPYYEKGSLGVFVTTLLVNLNLEETLPMTFFITMTGFFLLLTGGIVAIFKGVIGGILSVCALLLLSVTPSNLFDGFDWLYLMGLGYYGALIGVVLVFVSSLVFWKERRKERRREELDKALDKVLENGVNELKR